MVAHYLSGRSTTPTDYVQNFSSTLSFRTKLGTRNTYKCGVTPSRFFRFTASYNVINVLLTLVCGAQIPLFDPDSPAHSGCPMTITGPHMPRLPLEGIKSSSVALRILVRTTTTFYQCRRDIVGSALSSPIKLLYVDFCQETPSAFGLYSRVLGT